MDRLLTERNFLNTILENLFYTILYYNEKPNTSTLKIQIECQDYLVLTTQTKKALITTHEILMNQNFKTIDNKAKIHTLQPVQAATTSCIVAGVTITMKPNDIAAIVRDVLTLCGLTGA